LLNETEHKSLIWVVDDDADIRRLLDEYLSRHGFDVRGFGSAADALRWLPRIRPDLIVLDLMLRGMSGLELCKHLRDERDDVPILMLTARGEPNDRVAGFEAGADDYLPKPFLPRELIVRIEAILRRRGPNRAGVPVPKGDVIGFGHCKLNLATRVLTCNGEVVVITTGEFALLAAMATHPNQLLSRERLRELARGKESRSDERSIDVQISRLRKLIDGGNRKSKHIQTVWGSGYVFVPDLADDAT